MFFKTNNMALIFYPDWFKTFFPVLVTHWPMCNQNLGAISFLSRWAIQTVDKKCSMFRSEIILRNSSTQSVYIIP